MISGQRDIISNIAEIAYNNQRTWTRADGNEVFVSWDHRGSGHKVGAVHIKKERKYLTWKEDNGVFLKFACLKRAIDEGGQQLETAGKLNACINLGNMYRSGSSGLKQNWTQAMNLYKTALGIQYRPEALYFQAMMLEEGGHGLRKDRREAIRCLEKGTGDGYRDRPVMKKTMIKLADGLLSEHE